MLFRPSSDDSIDGGAVTFGTVTDQWHTATRSRACGKLS
jgi:hypothetical protein